MVFVFTASPNVDIKSLWQQKKKAVERKCKFANCVDSEGLILGDLIAIVLFLENKEVAQL